MNLVLIGKFKTQKDAENTKSLVERIAAQAVKDEAYDISRDAPEDQRFSDEMLKLLQSNRVHSISPTDLEQFALEHSISQKLDTINVTTDDADLSAFIKIFVDAGARVEIFSAHDYPEDGKKG